MQRKSLLLIKFLVFSMATGLADRIVLKNGDRLSGTIVQSDETELVIKTEFAGEVKVVADAIESIMSDDPVYVTLADGQTLVGSVDSSGGQVRMTTPEAGQVEFQRQSIRTIRSADAQAAWEAENERLRNPGLMDLWSGTLDAGLSLTRGNAETSTFSLGMNAVRATARDRFSVYASSLRASNSTTGVTLQTANAVRGGLRYDLDLSDGVFAFGLTDLEFDEFQQLDLRLTVGGGLGWHTRRTDRFLFDVFGGASLNNEHFSTGLDRNSGEMLVGEELNYKLSERLTLGQKSTLFPNLSESGEYRLNFDLSALTSISSWLGWHVTVSDRFLSNPVLGAESNDVLLTTGVQIKFGR